MDAVIALAERIPRRVRGLLLGLLLIHGLHLLELLELLEDVLVLLLITLPSW